MAKESMKAREVKRAKLVAKYAAKRQALKEAGDWAALDKLPAGHGMKGKLSYRLKKGSASKTYSWTGPGVMFGKASSSFAIAAK